MVKAKKKARTNVKTVAVTQSGWPIYTGESEEQTGVPEKIEPAKSESVRAVPVRAGYEIVRTEEQIDETLGLADELDEAGIDPDRNCTYAQGVRDGIRWLIGHDETPCFDQRTKDLLEVAKKSK